MPLISDPHAYVDGELLSAAIMNPPLQTIYAWANGNVDNANVGSAGFFANQIKPTSPVQATFGGSWGYTIVPGVTTQVPLTISGVAAQSADLLDVTLTSGGTKAMWVDSAGGFHGLTGTFSGAVSTGALTATTGMFTPSAQITASSTTGAISAALYFGNNQGGTGRSFLATQSSSSVGGVTGSVFVAGQDGLLNGLAMDTSGNLGVAGAFWGSGAHLTSIPWSALPYQPVQSVGAGSSKVSIGGTATAPTVDVVPANFTGIPNGALTNSTISGVALGGTLFALTAGTHLAGGPYTGAGAVTLTTDATSANTASTIVARDAGGAFAAGAITGTSLTSTGGVAAGGALTGATTGAFSGSVSSVGHVSNAANMQVLDTTAAAHGMRLTNTFTAGSDWNLVAGVTGFSPRSLVVFDQNSSAAVALFGDWTASGSGGLQVSSNKSTLAYVPPVYTTAGAALANTTHVVVMQVTITSGNSSVTTTLTGAAIFSSTPYGIITASPAGGQVAADINKTYYFGSASTGSSIIIATAGGAVGANGITLNVVLVGA